MKIIDTLIEQNILYNKEILNQDLVPLKIELINKNLFNKSIKTTFNSIKSLIKETNKLNSTEIINKVSAMINNKLLILNKLVK